MMRSRVDLPPPLGPSSAISSPVGMLREMSSQGDEVAELLADAVDLDAHDCFSLGRMIVTITMQATDTSASRKAVA